MDYRAIATQIAQQEGVPVDLFLRMIGQESAWTAGALSPKGASGLAQLMPGTARDLGVDPNDPIQNMTGGARYLRQQLDTFGRPDLALAAYNAGPGAVKKYGGIPPYRETQDYVRKILGDNEGQAVADDAMTALGLKPQGILTPKNTEIQPMIAKQPQARGLLDALGIQKMQEGAAGETGQRFYQRDTFKDTAATLAQGFAAMGSMPALQEMTANIAAQRTEKKAQNKTLEYLSKMPNGEELVKLAEIAGPAAVVQQVLAQRFAKPEEKVRQVRGSELGLTGPQADRIFNVDADNKVTAIGGTPPVTNINMGDKLSPGLKKLDESFAETYANLSMSGLADARSQAATIHTVLTKLEAGEPLTGPLIGIQPDFLRAITNPDAQDAIERIGSVVQRSLREILGGQFAQKEGEQLIRRAYNPSLPPAQNAARLRALFFVLDQTAKNKMDMATYYQENNYSLGGYKGNMGLPTREDFEAAMDAAAPAPQSPATMTPEDALKTLKILD